MWASAPTQRQGKRRFRGRSGQKWVRFAEGVWGCGARRVVRRGRVWEMFRASERDLLLATVPKVGKSTGRNLRFLHFRARYNSYRFVNVYHTFTGNFRFRFDKRIVFISAPLPLIPIPNNASASTVDTVSGSGARRKSIRQTLRHSPCSANAWYKVSYS